MTTATAQRRRYSVFSMVVPPGDTDIGSPEQPDRVSSLQFCACIHLLQGDVPSLILVDNLPFLVKATGARATVAPTAGASGPTQMLAFDKCLMASLAHLEEAARSVLHTSLMRRHLGRAVPQATPAVGVPSQAMPCQGQEPLRPGSDVRRHQGCPPVLVCHQSVAAHHLEHQAHRSRDVRHGPGDLPLRDCASIGMVSRPRVLPVALAVPSLHTLTRRSGLYPAARPRRAVLRARGRRVCL